MSGEPRVEDDDDSRWVFEGFGPANQSTPPDRLRIQRLMQRVVRDVLDHPEDYGALRDPMVLLAENYARTCQTPEELERRLTHDAEAADKQGVAASLLRRIWDAQVAADNAAGNGHSHNGSIL